jgi:alkylhydroperoxidase/carboxymuconolactone decarboxylase family protein YurZ
MPENPLKPLETIDPELLKAVEANRSLALSDGGALPRKYKYLIAMVLDATHGADAGVRSLATAALHAGATKEEIADALRVACFIDGVGCVYVAARGLDGLL